MPSRPEENEHRLELRLKMIQYFLNFKVKENLEGLFQNSDTGGYIYILSKTDNS